jgi:4-hydroxybenzoate polyprenyltransferase
MNVSDDLFEVIGIILFVIGFIIALFMSSAIIAYLLAIFIGVLFGYSLFMRRRVFVPLTIGLIGFFLGFLIGNITANLTLLIIFLIGGAFLGYYGGPFIKKYL